MISFDAPRRAVCTPKRERTNTPLQALILLNNPQVIEASIQLADRLRESHGHQVDSELAKQAFLAILGRPATDKELRISEQLLREQAALFNDQPDRITELTGTSKYKPTLPADAKFAALTLLCHTLFNHDGAVIKR